MNTIQANAYSKSFMAYGIINILIGIYSVITICRIAATPIIIEEQGWAYKSYGLTDFLINYQGGYVRRGLIGELIFRLSQGFNLDPRIFIYSICVASFAALSIIIFRKVNSQQLCWWILPLNICLSGCDFLRKDCLCMLFVLAAILAFVNTKQSWRRVIYVNTLIIIALNLHECVFFITYPIILLSFYSDNRINIKSTYRVTLTFPIVAMFIILSLYKGNYNIAQMIHNSWNIADMGACPTATIESLCWDVKYAVKFHLQENFTSNSHPIYAAIEKPLVWILTFILLPNILFYKNPTKNLQINRLLKITLLQFVALSPMLTILSCDQSRIFFYWTVSSILIYLYIPEHFVTNMFPRWYNKLCDNIQNLCYSASIRLALLPITLFICISPYSANPAKAFSCSVAGTYMSTIMIAHDIGELHIKNQQPLSINKIAEIAKKRISWK